ncbi:MAG: hypothetical protein RIR79_220 [Pseudomonadota bacterium]|jgi:endonuclease G
MAKKTTTQTIWGTLLLIIGAIIYGCLPNDKLYQGAPKSQSWNPYNWIHTLEMNGFVVGYSELRGNPLWVEYALTKIDESVPSLPRPTRFEVDSRSFVGIAHDDYTKSGYDRGHNAPNYAISHLYGVKGQKDSFLMTNISPQAPNLNRKFWQRLEEVEAKHFTQQADKIWVITGPIFTGASKKLSSSSKVEIPDAFYKIYITEAKSNKPSKALAFLVPQTVQGNEPLSQFVTSIDAIEEKAGFDFFPNLDPKIQTPLEASIAPKEWNLDAVNKIPSRY